MEHLLKVQFDAPGNKSIKLSRDKETGLLMKGHQIWIPEQLFETILIHAHVANRHGNLENEMKLLSKYSLEIPSRYKEQSNEKDELILRDLVKRIRHRCIHCRRYPQLLRRPLHITFLAKETRDILHLDY